LVYSIYYQPSLSPNETSYPSYPVQEQNEHAGKLIPFEIVYW